MKKLSEATLTVILCTLIIALCFFSADAKAGASDGLRMCEEIIIPSLLPVLIICKLIISSRAARNIEAVFGRAFERLFRLPRCTACAVIFGLIGGYPTGCVLTHHLYCKGLIDGEQAKRLMRFNFCGGGAFIITAVGTVTYGSTKTGLLLLACCILSAVTIMLLTGIRKPCPKQICRTGGLPVSEALPDAVEATVKALAVMSTYIILFSALRAIITPPQSLMPIFEITAGVCGSDVPLPLPYCAFFLSFGGLCLHLQLYGFLKQMDISYSDFLTFRMLAALISFALMKGFLFVFPQSAEVFSNIAVPQHSFSDGGITLSLVMIIGCAVVIFDIENRKLKLI